MRHAWAITSRVLSVGLRRFVVSPVFRVILGTIALVSGEWGTTSRGSRSTNARLWLERARDLRRPEVRLLAERLGTDGIELCLLGAAVRVERRGEVQTLYGSSAGMVGQLVPHRSGPKLFTCDGPGLDGPVYALCRSDRSIEIGTD